MRPGGSRPRPREPAGRARSRTRFALVALQAALSLGLLTTGAQFVRTVQGAATNERIPHPETLVLASFDVDPLRLSRDAGNDFYRRLLDRVSRVPGVAAAGFGGARARHGCPGQHRVGNRLAPGFARRGRGASRLTTCRHVFSTRCRFHCSRDAASRRPTRRNSGPSSSTRRSPTSSCTARRSAARSESVPARAHPVAPWSSPRLT